MPKTESWAGTGSGWRRNFGPGIPNDEAANAYLENEYVPEHNRRCAQSPPHLGASPPVAERVDLDAVFRLEEERPISGEWVVQYPGRLFQIQRESAYDAYPRPRARLRMAGSPARDRYRGRAVKWREIRSERNGGHFYRGKVRDISNEPCERSRIDNAISGCETRNNAR